MTVQNVFYILYAVNDENAIFMMIRFLTEAPRADAPLVLALGVFDAVHLGHREIISRAALLAKEHDAKVVAVTFFPHPREVLAKTPPVLLLPKEARIVLLRNAGADAVGTIDFSREFATWSAEKFCQMLWREFPHRIAGIVVGSNWRFGKGGEGNAAFLQKFFASFHVETLAVIEKSYQEKIISASRIREAIAAGDFDSGSAMLGRPVALYGIVRHGFGDAGKLLAAPTLNLEVVAGVFPPDGVYAGRIMLPDGRFFPAAVNCGIAPTFGDRTRRIEAHLIDFSGDLYDKKVKLEFCRFIRAEKRFASVGELKAQIARDIALCREAAK